jgi:hypothetical protein
MHIGLYSEEGQTIKKLHNFIKESGYEFDRSKPGEKHHEIYIGDVCKANPEKLKTFIRQPIKKKK